MNTSSKNLTRGKWWRLLLCLTLAFVMAAGFVVEAAVLDNRNTHHVTINMPYQTWPGYYDVYGDYTTSTNSRVNLGLNGLFSASASTFKGVNYAWIEIDINQRSSIRVEDINLDGVVANLGSQKLDIEMYSSSNYTPLSYSDFNTLLNNITLYYDSDPKWSEQTTANVTLRFYGWKTTNNHTGKGEYQQIRYDYYRYHMAIDFLDYASGATTISDANPVVVSYENSADSGNVVEGSVDVNSGVATVPWQFTNFGDAKRVTYGYQVRPATGTFTEDTPYTTVGTLDLSRLSNSKKQEQLALARTMDIKGFNADTQYYARLVFVTDGDNANKSYSEEIPIRYDKPVISGFNMANINKIYQGGETTNLTMTGSFNNSNYDNISYCYDSSGNVIRGCSGTDEAHNGHTQVTGPRLQAKVYFSSDYEEVVQSDGTVLVSGNTNWTPVGDAITIDLQTGADIARTFDATKTKWDNVQMPKIDSRLCTFKAELTDVVTGYTVTKFFTASTDSSGARVPAVFTIDTAAPSIPTVTAKVGEVGYDNPAPSHALTVGGEGGAVVLDIVGGTDITNGMLGSGVAEYAYSMYYLSSENVPGFAGDGATVEDALNGLAALDSTTAVSNSYIEYTDWTSLSTTVTTDETVDPPTEVATASFTISNDGYYRMDVRTKDVAGHTSTSVQQAYFRVDLTPPSTPQVFLAQGETIDTLNPYDNRTYKNETVWMLVNSAPITGKEITTWEYSNDGGLTWRALVSPEGSDVTAANLKENTTNHTVNVYSKGSYTAMEPFEYKYALNLTKEGHDDYETFIFRVVDAFGNTSQVSDAVVMRTIAAQPEGSFTLKHEGIEVALALGNTNISSSTLTAEMKNAAAQKLNEAFYGDEGVTSPTDAADFNPWKYFKTLKHAADTLNSDCYWTGDSSASGSCSDGANCPYAKLAALGHNLYLPEQINVQGISGASANDSSLFDWVRYDHTNYELPTMPDDPSITTTLYTGTTVSTGIANAIPTDLSGPKAYKNETTDKYIRSEDRVVYTGQTTPGVLATSGSTYYSTGPNSHAIHTYWASATLGSTTVSGDWEDGGKTTSIWAATSASGGGTVVKRLYHMMDVSYPMTSYSNYAKSWDATSDEGGDLTSIATAGYRTGTLRDWLFLYNDQPTKKTIYFTIDDGTAFPHANDGYGFLFNTTIRQSAGSAYGGDGSWRLSGYLFYIGNPTNNGSGDLSAFKWFIVKLEDINMEHFADGVISYSQYFGTAGFGKTKNSGSTKDDLATYLLDNYPNNYNSYDNYGLNVIAYATPFTASSGTGQGTGSYNINNFVLVIEGTTTKLYNYKSNTYSTPNSGEVGPDRQALKDKFLAEVTTTTPNGLSDHTQGYKLVTWTYTNNNQYMDSTDTTGGTIYTPRPTVDGFTIGAVGNSIHTDTDCYGFGPMVSSREISHTCTRDSRITFTNINMQVDVARTLAEVVSEPQWGDGKAKYIMNLTDDSSTDFNDPIMSAQVQWRLFNDDAKYIGWGVTSNEQITQDFLTRIEGTGMYEKSDTGTRVTQIDEISEYITQAYYAEFGYDTTTGDPVIEQIEGDLSAEIAQQGVAFDLDDMENYTLNVTDYNSSSANPDFPEGRWWIIHDVNGYPNAEKSARSDAWSDALELTINDAGRWTVYFAPDRGSDGYPINLDPADAVFNFTVNETPISQFTGGIVDNKISISNDAYDPETYDPGVGFGTYTGETLDGKTIQLTGLVSSSWRWEMLSSAKDENGADVLTTLASDVWKTGTITDASSLNSSDANPLSGKTIQNLTLGYVKPDGEKHANVQSVSTGAKYFSSIPAGAVLTVYQYVTDVSTYVTGYETAADGSVYVEDKNNPGTKVIGKTYYDVAETRANTNSGVVQQNITESDADDTDPIVYAPQAAFSLDKVNLYSTALDTDKVTITRESLQTQGNANFYPGWAIDLNDGMGYRLLYRVASTGTWYLAPDNYYMTGNTPLTESEQRNMLELPDDSLSQDRGFITGSTEVLLEAIEPAQTDGMGTGSWTISKPFIAEKNTDGKIILRITESISGVKDVMGNLNTTVSDQSARAIYYKDDTNPPTAQSVSAKIFTQKDDGTYESSNYAAGSYLDVSNDRAYIELTVGGSVEREGQLAGYRYYFYKTTGSGTTAKTTYYKQEEFGGELAAKNNETDATSPLGAEGGTIKITRETMEKDPLDSLNLAVYAIDTAGNKTTPTRYENIKLSVSEPAKTAITATDSLGSVVNSIGNDYVFYDPDDDSESRLPNFDASAKPNPAGTGDQMTVDSSTAYTNSTVNIAFTPKTGRFGRNGDGDYELETDTNKDKLTGTAEMFADAFNQADLTNTALIIYSVLVRTNDQSAEGYGDIYDQYAYYYTTESVTDPETGVSSMQRVYWKDREISASRTLSLTEDNTYRVVARVRNGAGTLSKAQMIQFTIDKTAPTEITDIILTNSDEEGGEYKSTEWSDGVIIEVGGSQDANTASAHYEYSIDNGATWIQRGSGLNNSAFIEFETTGEYTVMVRATDQAGNSSTVKTMTVKIDKNPPVMSAPTLSATSKLVTLYTDYVISVEHTPAGGEVYTQYEKEDGSIDYTNLGTEFVVPSGATQTFKIVPEADHLISAVTLGGVDMMSSLVYDEDTGDFMLTTPEVTADTTLKVTFVSTNVTYQSMYAMAESSAQTSSAISETLQTLAAELAADSGDTTGDDTTTGDGTTDDTTGDGTTDDTTGGEDTGDGTTDGDGETPTEGPHSVTIVEGNGATFSGTVDGEEFSGNYSKNTVPHNAIVDLNINVWRGYELKSLLINSAAVPFEELTYDEVTDTYTYEDFAVTETLRIQLECDYIGDNVRLVDISSGIGGTVRVLDSPAYVGERDGDYYKVYEGKTLYIEVTPDTGYSINSLTAGGAAPDGVPFPMAGSYTYYYTVPEGEETDILDVKATFTVSDPTKAAKITLNVEGEVHGGFEGVELDENGSAVIELPANTGSYTVKIIPDEHYTIGSAVRDMPDPLDEEAITSETVTDTILNSKVTNPDGSVYYQFTFPAVKGDSNALHIQFVKESFPLHISSTAGGVINVTGYVGDRDSIEWGTELTVTATSLSGYRIGNLSINGVSLGAVKTHTFTFTEETTITGEFIYRDIASEEMVHSIEVVANNISDKEDALAAVPYRFQIKKEGDPNYSNWSEWQTGNTISFNNLDPNSKYTVKVQAKDVVGNENESEAYIYTLANSPEGLELISRDEENNSLTKGATMVVDPMGNPETTEYKVYYSSSANMTNLQTANSTVNNGWAPLTLNSETGEYEYAILGLTPGQRYYMQIVARNVQGVETRTNADNILSIQLSHEAPPENSLRFSEQAGPMGGVTLSWNNPPEDVTSVEIYRDGSLIREVSKELVSYTDPRDNIPADKVCVYSYAYKNDAGAGSRRTAISDEYYAAVLDANTTKKQQMDNMAKADDPTNLDLFTQLLTYPAYPSGVTGTAQALGSDAEDSGTLTVTVNYNPMYVGRPQAYKLGLNAYIADSNDLVDGWEVQYRTTEANTASGAIAEWSGLNVNYEYSVFIEEIYTTGPRFLYDDNNNGTNEIDAWEGSIDGVEGFLGKKYTVNANGYKSEYLFADTIAGYGITLNTVPESEGKWTDDEEKLAYTNGLGWGNDFGPRFKFNKSPQIALAEENLYAESANLVDVPTEDKVDDYILVDQTTDPTFQLNVVAWDPDGTAAEQTKTATLRAQVAGNVTSAVLSGITNDELPDNETDAKAKPFTLDFSVSSTISTGFYEGITLSANDGEITYYNDEGVIDLVVNQTKPTISATVKGSLGGASEHKIEVGKTYKSSLLDIETRTSVDPDKLRPVRLRVMAETYKELFGSYDFDTIVTNLSDPDSTATANAKDLLEDAYDNSDITKLAKDAIDAVNPPYTAYVQITNEEHINTYRSELVEEPVGSGYRYWAKVSDALKYGICSWFTGNATDGYTITGELDSKHPLRIVANFGNNTNTAMLYFACVSPASLVIESSQAWQWVEVDEPEYNYYATKNNEVEIGDGTNGYTIAGIYDIIDDPYVNAIPPLTCPPLPEGINDGDLAYKKEGDKLYVYKLHDSLLEIFEDEISGWVTVTTGVYDQFTAAYVLVADAELPDDLTSLDVLPDGVVPVDVKELGSASSAVTGQGVKYYFESDDFTPGTPYYLYTAYKYKDPADNVEKTVIDTDNTIIITTDVEYALSRYGFNRANMSFIEDDQEPHTTGGSGTERSVEVVRTGDIDVTSADINFTAAFYQADQFGNILTDETTGEPIPLKTPDLENAMNVFSFHKSTRGDIDTTLTFNREEAKKTLLFYLRENNAVQQHMVVRVTMTVGTQHDRYNRIKESAGTVDIFILDKESHVTEYKVGVDNTADDNGKTLDEVKTELTGGEIHIDYEYQFEGLQVGYSSNETRTITLINNSDPEGALSGIKAEIYETKFTDEEQYEEHNRILEKISDDFQINWAPDTSLAARDTDPYASTTLQVTAKHGKDDGVYEAWLNIWADHVDPEDQIWIKLTQVVGQSTLSGRIYYTQTAPDDSALTGVSKVYLYAYENASSDGQGNISGEILYQTETSEMGGYFEIPNIINNQRYYLVVERDGYITYDPIFSRSIDQNISETDATQYYFKTDEESRSYELSLQLRGGDIDGDVDIDMDDYALLNTYFNSYYGGDAADDWTEEFRAGVKKADFNCDKVVNVFDRMIFWDSYSLRLDNNYNNGNKDALLCSGAYKYLDNDRPMDLSQGAVE